MKLIDITINEGRFTLFEPKKTSWWFTIKTSDKGTAKVCCDEEPNLSFGFGVEDAVYEMREAFKHVWTGGKEESLKTLDAIFDDLDRYELAWAKEQIAPLEARVDRAKADLQGAQDNVELLEGLVLEAAS